MRALFLIAILLLSGCVEQEQKVVEVGDTVDFGYIGKLSSGAVFDTTYPEVAMNASIEKTPPFQLRTEYKPLRIYVGGGKIIKDLEDALLGMEIGEEKTVEIPPERGYGPVDPRLFRQISREVTQKRKLNLSVESFKSQFGRDPVAGDVIENPKMITNITVLNVSDENVTIRQDSYENATLSLKEDIGSGSLTVVKVTEEDIIMRYDFIKDAYVQLSPSRKCRVQAIDDEKVVFDCNHPLAGKKLIFVIRVENITKWKSPATDDDPSLGPGNAKVIVVLFSDFQCPYCAAAEGSKSAIETIEYLKSRNPGWEPAIPRLREMAEQGKIRLIFRDFPLERHENAQKAAEAGECAHEQGKFWEYHDILFENQQKLDTENLKKYAADLGLAVSEFNTCLESGKMREEVLQDVDDGKKIGVTGTPTLFVNRVRMLGTSSLSNVESVVKKALEEE